MSNLIVSIIAIALAAVAAVMATYYGGNAYEQSAAQAKAMILYNQSQGIIKAWSAYGNSNSGMMNINGTYNAYTNTSLVPNYIQIWPVAPTDVVAANSNWSRGYNSWQTLNHATLQPADTGEDSLYLVMLSSNYGYQVCRALHKLYNGQTAEPLDTNQVNVYTTTPQGIGNCSSTGNAGGVYQSGAAVQFFYRVW